MSIYLDNSATTRVRQEALEAMQPYLSDSWGNPSSIHTLGRKGKSALHTAREQVAHFLRCHPEEIYFSPCGTYSNNVALLGRARFAEANGLGRHLITTQIEHPSVLGPAKYLESNGWKVSYLPVDREGLVRLSDLEAAITDQTSIISIMWANNEIGAVQPIAPLAALACQRDIYFHTDAVQVAGKLPIDLQQLPVSTLALSGHKFHAPKGIGVLFVRRLCNLMPIAFGGGQEMGLFPGTEGLANIVGLGAAARHAGDDLPAVTSQLQEMQQIIASTLTGFNGVRLTGPPDWQRRLPGHVSVVLPGVEGEAIVMRADLKGICVSSGSACHQGIIEPSQVLRAIGLSDHEAMGSLRVTAGIFNTPKECKQAADALTAVFKSLLKDTQQRVAAMERK